MSCCACQPRAVSDDEGATHTGSARRDTSPVAQAPHVTNCFPGSLSLSLPSSRWPGRKRTGSGSRPACVTLDCHLTSLSFWLLIYKWPGLLSPLLPAWDPFSVFCGFLSPRMEPVGARLASRSAGGGPSPVSQVRRPRPGDVACSRLQSLGVNPGWGVLCFWAADDGGTWTPRQWPRVAG